MVAEAETPDDRVGQDRAAARVVRARGTGEGDDRAREARVMGGWGGDGQLGIWAKEEGEFGQVPARPRVKWNELTGGVARVDLVMK